MNKLKNIPYYYFLGLYKLFNSIISSYRKGGKFFYAGNVVALIVIIFISVIFASIKVMDATQKSTTFYQDLFTKNLYHKGSDFQVTLSEQNSTPKQEISAGNSKLSITLANTHIKTENDNLSILDKFIPKAQANFDLSENVSFQYEILQDRDKIEGSLQGLKENIILKDKNAPRSFQFAINMEGVSRYNQVDGNWYFYKDNCPVPEKPSREPIVQKDCPSEVVFYIPAAFMTDAKGEKSYQVTQQIQQNENGEHILILSADENWLNDENRAWPVTVDPTVVVSGTIADADAQFGGLQKKLVYASGHWYAFYSDEGILQYKKSRDGGSWSSPVLLEGGGETDNYNPTVWLEASTIYVAWIDDSGDAVEVTTINTSTGDKLGTKCTSSDQGSIGSSFTVSLAVTDDGTVYFAYSDTSTDTEDADYKLTYSNCTFTDITSGSGQGDGDRPVITTTGNTLHLFFQDGDLSYSTYNGTAWTASNNTLSAATDTTYDVATDGSLVWILTIDSTSSNFFKVVGGATITDINTAAGTNPPVSIYCISTSDCKLAYIDSTNDDLIFYDCADAACSTGTATTLDTDVGTSTWVDIYCVATDDCKIIYDDDDAGSQDMTFIDCDDATCSTTGTPFDVDGTFNNGAGAIYCVASNDCKIAYIDDNVTDLFFVDCNSTTCNTNSTQNLDTSLAAVANFSAVDIYCISSTDCKVVYFDSASPTDLDVTFIDCDDTDCATRDANNDLDTAAANSSVAIYCPTSTDCKVTYVDGNDSDLHFVDCFDTDCLDGSNNPDSNTSIDTDMSTTNNGRPAIQCVSATDCKVFYNDDNDDDATFIDCTDAGCTAPTATDIDSDVGNHNIRPDLYCIATDDCKLIYYDSTDGDVTFVDCGSDACAVTAATTLTSPWTGQTEVESITLTYDNANADLYASIIKDSSDQAYYKFTDSTSISWSSEYSYNFTAGDLAHISAPAQALGPSQVGVLLRQGSNLEFAGPTTNRLFYKFDEGVDNTCSGGTNDTCNSASTGSTVDGAVSGPVWQPENLCVSGKCLFFDGSNDFVSTGDNSLLDFAANESFTVEAWVRHNGTIATNPDYIITKADTSTGGYKVYMDASGDFCFDIDDDGTFADSSACTTAIDFDDDKWHHVTGVRDVSTDTIYLYVDGRQRATATDNTTTTLQNTNTFYVGVDRDGTSNPWAGNIDAVRVFGTAHSANQVRADYIARGTMSSGLVLGANADNADAFSNGLTANWKMDEALWNGTASEVVDSSGNSRNGVRVGSATTSTLSKFGNAGIFDGVNDAVSLGTTDPLPSKTQVTYAAWINLDNVVTTQSVFQKDRGNAGGWSVFISNTSVGFYSEPTANTVSASLATGTWYHLVWTFDNGTVKFYKNGAFLGSASGFPTLADDGATFDLGLKAVDSTEDFQGRMDDVRMYDRVLTSNDVADLYNFGPKPMGYWKLDEKIGTTAYDTSGNSNNLTLTNTPTWTTGKYSAALNFAGSDQHITRADDADFDFGDDASMTYEAWIKHSAATAQEVILSKYNEAGYKLIMESDGDLTCALDYDATFTPTDSATSTAATYDDDKWHHIACVKVGNTSLNLYIDGVLIASDTSLTATNTLTNSDPLYIGIDADGTSNDFIGQIDEPRIYTYARSPRQLIEDMNAGHPAPGSPVGSPVSYWKFDEGALNTCSGGTNDFCDGSVNANDLAFSTTTGGYTMSGKYGKAFNGTNAVWASRADDADLDFSETDNFSISLWFKSDSANNPGATEYVVNKAASNEAGYAIYANTSGNLCFGIDDDTTWTPDVASCTPTDVYDATWHHLVAVRDILTDTNYLYIDGTLRDSDNDTTTATLANSQSFLVADRDSTDNGDEFAGDVDELKVYRSALTVSQVALDKNQGSGQALGATSDNSNYEKNAANQEYCVPGDSTTCTAPVGEWHLNEKAGTSAFDTSGTGSLGTWNGTGSHWSTGKVGAGGIFNGTDDDITAADTTALSPTNVSISHWFYPTAAGSAGDDEATIWKGDIGLGDDQSYGFIWTDSSTVKFRIGNSSTSDDVTSSTITLNQWTHVEGTYDGTNLRIYINGKLDSSKTSAIGSLKNTTSKLYVGASAIGDAGFEFFQGKIDEVRIFNYGRTPAQVAWDYNQGKPIGQWKMDECTGTTIYDNSGNSNNGTWTGSAGVNGSAGDCNTASSTTAWYNGRTGKMNSSLDFDSSDDVVTITNASPIDFDTGLSKGMSFTGWIYVDSDGENDVGEWLDKGSNTYCRVDSESGGRVDVECQIDLGTTDANVNVSSAIATGGWHHIALSYDDDGDDDTTIYIDGIARGTGSGDGSPATSDSNNLLIGGDSAANFDGKIDDVRVYNYGITAAQVRTIMNQGGTVRYGPSTGTP